LETNPMQGGPARRRGAIGQDDTRSPDHHCSEYLMAKNRKRLENQEAFLPLGCCISKVLHRCGDEKGAIP